MKSDEYSLSADYQWRILSH